MALYIAYIAGLVVTTVIIALMVRSMDRTVNDGEDKDEVGENG